MTIGNVVVDSRYRLYSSWYGVDGFGYGRYRHVEWTGDDTPKPRPKVMPQNQFHKSWVDTSNEPIVFLKDGGEWSADSAIVTSGSVPWVRNDVMVNIPDVEMWAKVREALYSHDLNVAVAFAEGNKTLSMLADTTKRVLSAARAAKSGKPVVALKHLGYRWKSRTRMRRSKDGHEVQITKDLLSLDFASLWLELKYGWLPLYSDIFEGMKFVYNATNRPLVKRFKVTKRKTEPWIITTCPMITNKKTVRTTRYVELYDGYEPSYWESLGLDDPLTVVWELVPFSFVFDWFIPVGNYLAARSMQRRLNGRCYNVYHQRREFMANVPAGVGNAISGAVLKESYRESARYSEVNNRYDRGVWYDIRQWSGGSVKLPSMSDLYKFTPSWQKAVTSVALLTQLGGQALRNAR